LLVHLLKPINLPQSVLALELVLLLPHHQALLQEQVLVQSLLDLLVLELQAQELLELLLKLLQVDLLDQVSLQEPSMLLLLTMDNHQLEVEPVTVQPQDKVLQLLMPELVQAHLPHQETTHPEVKLV
jgi:hypothetical protein